MRVVSIVYLDFLDVHGDYYMATVYIHLHSFFAIQFNSRKTLLLLLNVESNKILLLLNSTPLPTNKARNGREWRSLEDQDQNKFQTSLLFFLALCFSLSRTHRKRG